jgi:branched-chain amino acid transport system ATP-binding protein
MTAGHEFLTLRDVEAVYDDAILALRGLSLDVSEGQIVALLGANGAGKSTTLKAISNLLPVEGGSVRSGTILWQGVPVTDRPANRLVAEGLVQVLEGRHVFPQLTVDENLQSGGFVRRPSRSELASDIERVFAWFPRLRERRRSRAGLLSGGEQQMLAIGRALMTRPRLVLLDEPSMGLAPIIVQEIFDIVRALNRSEGVTFLLAEQNANLALRYADTAYVLDNGRVLLSGRAAELAERDEIKAIYLGETASPPTAAATVAV